MQKKWLGLLLAAVIAVGGGYYWYSSSQTETKENYTLGEVTKGDIAVTIDATGTIEPVNSVDLSATVSGTLQQMMVKQNEQVSKGQQIAVIESKAAQSTLQQAKNTLANKESYYFRMRRLYRQGAVSYQDMDDARLEYLNSQAAYDKAEADVNDTIVLSPMDGTIIGEPMKEGSTVSQGLSSQMIIATVADLSSMQIELLVDETDIGEVAVGQDVTFTVDAYPNHTFHGRVENISKKEYSSSSSTSSSSSVVYYTVYVLINSDELDGLYPSMTARAEIQGRSDKDALLIPITAVRSDASGSYVYRKTASGVEKAYIETGITTNTHAEVLSGLSDGEEIVVSGTVSQEKAEVSAKNTPRGPRF